MEYKELFKKYQALLVENNNLKKELLRFKAQLGISEYQVDSSDESFVSTSGLEMSGSECKYNDFMSSGINNIK